MEERCQCGMKIKPNDEVVCCNKCGTKYHKPCWEVVSQCYKCGEITSLGMKSVEKEASELRRIEAEQEKYQARINHLKATGRDGYYEYKVISIVDKRGAVDTQRLMNELNDLGLDGWRLQCAYTNEMGKDSLSIAGFGINSTADQNILIFERFVKFE